MIVYTHGSEADASLVDYSYVEVGRLAVLFRNNEEWVVEIVRIRRHGADVKVAKKASDKVYVRVDGNREAVVLACEIDPLPEENR